MNVLLFNLGADTGGVLIATVRAFRNEPGWNVHSIVSSTNFIGYAEDVPYSAQNVNQYWEAAEVVHLHHNFRSADRLNKRLTGRRIQPKPFVLEYHGTGFRETPRAYLAELEERGAVGIVSTLDLHLVAPETLEWVPVPVNVEALSKMRQPTTERVLICHAPTHREIKSTEHFLDAVKRLQDEGYPVDLDLIERRPWAECLERKAKADIYFDQVILGYGCNALEAWGMGIPVVAGAADETLDEMERRFGHLPFYHATEETIYDALKDLVESPELRAKYGKIGQEYVRKYHDEPVVVEQLKGIYQRALGDIEKAA